MGQRSVSYFGLLGLELERFPHSFVWEREEISFCFSHGAASGLDVTMEGSHSVTQSDKQSWDITLASAITLV